MIGMIYILATFAALLIFTGSLPLHAESSLSIPDAKVKTDYLYNFAKFVEWPEKAFKSPDDPIIIAILAEEPLDYYLDQKAHNTKIHGRSITVRRFRTINDLEPCHVLYVDESKKRSISDILYIIEDWPVLIVSDMKELTKRGGIINFIDHDDGLSFEINAKAAEQAQIKISSKLLKLAHGMNKTH